jgi:EmrB/QacA subfamily drug resistance transporter
VPVLDRKWWTLIAVSTATFMLLLDITVVNVALPDIQRSLNSSFSDLQWVVNAYTLTLAAFLLTAGVIGDMFGRREVFAAGIAIFTISSLLCGVSTSPLMLNLARAAQGIGGAVMFATSLALIAQAFQGRDRGTAFGVYGATIGGAVAVGPLVGGALTSGIGWRWIFFVNVPIGVFAVFLTLTRVVHVVDRHSRRIDWFGFASFSGALFLLVLALVQGNNDGWKSAKIVGLLVGAAVLLVAFVIGERRQREPMLDLDLFKKPAVVGLSIATFALAASIFAMFLYLTLYIQDDLGYAPFAAGLRFLPITMLSFFVAPFAGRLTVRVQSRFPIALGLLFVSVGCFLMGTTTATSAWTHLLVGFIITGTGIGLVNPVLASGAVAVVAPERSGMASGTNSTFRMVGVATGVAALGAIFQSLIEHKTVSALNATSTGQAIVQRGGTRLLSAMDAGAVRQAANGLPAPVRPVLLHAYGIAFSSTLNDLLTVASGTALVGAVLSFFLVRQRDFISGAHAAEAAGVPEPVVAL